MSEEEALKKEHRVWVRKQQKNNMGGRKNREDDEVAAFCINCWCKGNEECQHKPLNDKMGCCMEQDDEICPCCRIEIRPAADVEYDKAVGQGQLF